MTVSDVSLRIKDDHEVIHENVTKCNPQRENKTCVLRNPNGILKRRSNRLKENIKAFITFKTRGDVKFKNFVDIRNCKIQRIVNRDRLEWQCMLKKDVDLFIYLSKYFKVDAYKLFNLYLEEYEIIKNKKRIKTHIELLSTNTNIILNQELRGKHILDFFYKKK